MYHYLMGRGGCQGQITNNLLYGKDHLRNNFYKKLKQEDDQSLTAIFFNGHGNQIGTINWSGFDSNGYLINDQETEVVIIVNNIKLNPGFNSIKYCRFMLDETIHGLNRAQVNVNLKNSNQQIEQLIDRYWQENHQETRDSILFVTCSHCQHQIPYQTINQDHQISKQKTDHLQIFVACPQCKQDFKLIVNFC
jgi:hypothetical protein